MNKTEATAVSSETVFKTSLGKLDLRLCDKNLVLTQVDLASAYDRNDENLVSVFKLNSQWMQVWEVDDKEGETDENQYCALTVKLEPKVNSEKMDAMLRDFVNSKLKKSPFYFRTVQGDQIVDYFMYPSENREYLSEVLKTLDC